MIVLIVLHTADYCKLYGANLLVFAHHALRESAYTDDVNSIILVDATVDLMHGGFLAPWFGFSRDLCTAISCGRALKDHK